MKNTITLVCLMAITQLCLAQGPYYFGQSSGSYANLSSPTIVSGAGAWTWIDEVVPIGFAFNLFGTDYTNVTITSIGMVTFNANYDVLIEAFGAELVDRALTGSSQSPIGYQLEGTTPNRVFKIEWANQGLMKELDSLGTTDLHVSFQLWLYEGSNRIEMHYGPSQTDDYVFYPGTTGPYVGLSDWVNNIHYKLVGDASTPSLQTTDMALSSAPANGTVYIFSTTPLGYAEVPMRISATMYPNPAADIVSVLTGNGITQVELVSPSGQTITSATSNGGPSIQIDLSDLPSGIYMIRMGDQTGRISVAKLAKI